MLDRDGIKAIIPHREPFLLVDRISELEVGVRAVGELDVAADMFWVPGHFPGYPVMPGVLIVEACAQVGAVALLSLPENAGRIALFGGADKVRFKRQVRPGDTLRMECAITKRRGPIGFGTARAWVGDQLACSGDLMFAIQ
jgi:3-hydroxyacyl-[acyl-carrier-protein] dehydratase